MQVRFDALNRFEAPKLYLCNPGSEYNEGVLSHMVGILIDTCDEELVLNFNSLSELNFRVNKVRREDPEENLYAYELYKSVQNRRMIYVDDIGYFVIVDVTDGYSDGQYYKDVRAESCEVEIQNKVLPYVGDNTYQFTDLLETIVEAVPLWKIALNGTAPAIDESVANRYRTFEDVSAEENCLNFMLEEMQDAYECIFCFDCVHRTISVYDQNNFVRDTSIHITKDDVINSIDISETSDDLYTSINVLGDDDLGIGAVNPAGSSTIYNFDYYLDWMTPELRESVIAWRASIDSVADEYYALNEEYYDLMDVCYNLQADIDALNMQNTMYKRCRDNIVAESSVRQVAAYNDVISKAGGTPISIRAEIAATLADIDSLMANVNSQISSKQSELDTKTVDLNAHRDSIAAIVEEHSITKWFVKEVGGVKDTHLLDELYNYIYEGSYKDEYIATTGIMTNSEKLAQVKTLYERAKSQLEKISHPTQEFSIDAENFLFSKEFKEWSYQLETGSLINVELDDNDIAALFLSTITVNYDDKSLGLTFGNRFNRFDSKSLFEDALGSVSKSANTLSYVKDIIYPIKQGELDRFQDALNISRTLTKNLALSADSQQVILDDTGYTGRRVTDGVVDDEQIKIANNSIVFTDDAWDSCKTAIGEIVVVDEDGNPTTTYGINAETIIGNMIIGGGLKIYDENGNDLFSVMDNKIEASFNAVNNETDEKFEGWRKYIRLENGDIEMGYIGGETEEGSVIPASDIVMHLSNNQLQFLVQNTPVAYFKVDEDDREQDKLFITQGEFTRRLDIGKFAWIPRDNGNLSFKKVKD